MSSINVNTIKSRLGGPPTLPSGVVVSAAATFSNDVSIGGTLTYEDVTNVDAVGLITARNGIKFGVAGVGGTIRANGDTTLAGVVTASQFVGDGSGLTNLVGTGVTNNVNTVNLNVISGISTFGGDVSIADKIIHTGDTNTAIRFPTADTITAETGGSERLRITSGGKVCINNDVALSDLHIATAGSGEQDGTLRVGGSAADLGLVLDYDQSGSTTARIYANDDYDSNTSALKICSDLDDNPNQLVLLGSGNIGINTSTPQQMLDVRGSAVIGIDQRSGNPGTTVGILTVRGHHVNSDSDYAQLYLSNSLSSGTASASIRAGRSGDNYGTTLSFYNNPTGGVAETERMRITAGGVVKVAGITSTASLTVGPGIIQEKFYNQGSALTGTYNHDLNSDGMVLYAYANASASFILNVRGNASTTLNSLMHIGQTSVFTAYTGSNNTSYYMTDFKIDGASQTEKWNGGTAPTAGTGSGTDVYTFNILKTADATFVVYATFSNFA